MAFQRSHFGASFFLPYSGAHGPSPPPPPPPPPPQCGLVDPARRLPPPVVRRFSRRTQVRLPSFDASFPWWKGRGIAESFLLIRKRVHFRFLHAPRNTWPQPRRTGLGSTSSGSLLSSSWASFFLLEKSGPAADPQKVPRDWKVPFWTLVQKRLFLSGR